MAAGVYQGRDTEAFDRYDTLRVGESVTLLDAAEGWWKVRTPRGATGWVEGNTLKVTEGPVRYETTETQWSAAYVNQPVGTAAPKTAWRTDLQAISPGVLRLTVQSTDQRLGDPVAEKGRLRVPFATGQTAGSVLPIASLGVESLTTDAAGIGLLFSSLPSWQVRERSANRLVVELRPMVRSADVRTLSDRTVYTLGIDGSVVPRTAAAGPEVTITLPGARLGGVTFPPGLKATETDAGVTLTLVTRNPYALKQVGNVLSIHVYQPGLAGKVILLDPGHGGPDGGANNALLGVREKEVNLQVALRLRAILAAKGATVYMTRATDAWSAPPDVRAAGGADDLQHVDLAYRVRLANELNVDLFLSIHHNAGGGSGTETYYTVSTLNGERSQALARLLQSKVSAGLSQVDRGARPDLMYVTRNTNAPSALVEVGFLTNLIEGRAAKTPAYQDKAAKAMLQALEAFYAARTD